MHAPPRCSQQVPPKFVHGGGEGPAGRRGECLKQRGRRQSEGSASGQLVAPVWGASSAMKGGQERPPEPRRSRKCWMRLENSRSAAISFSIFSTA